ncbi:SMC5-SMC6 complex localization factor protein 2 isoform X3 [Antennarius striatus]|uniref:SMC5-SMC6 complex localization factor protein 2 isoform X3 n=1 Tax=Antennarius striatus TaxID=241820 RepID=UPI0035B41601
MDKMIRGTEIHGSTRSPVYTGASSNQLHPMPRDRVVHSAHLPGSSCSSLPVVGPANKGTAAQRPNSTPRNGYHSASHQFMKDLSNHSPSSHIRRDQVTEPSVNLVSGRENATAQRQEFIKDTHHKRTPSEASIPDRNHSFQKRCRVLEDSDKSVKKTHLQGEYNGRVQTSESTVGNLDHSSLASQSSSGHSPVLELSLKTTDNLLCTEPTSGHSSYLELLSTFKSTQPSPCTPSSPKQCLKKQPSVGAKQVSIKSIKEHLLKTSEASNKRSISSSFSVSRDPKKDIGSSPNFYVQRCPTSGHVHSNTSHANDFRSKTDSTINKSISKSNSSCHTVKQTKVARSQRSIPVPDDINELFTPDPRTYVIYHTHHTAKPKINGATKNFSTSDKSHSDKTMSSSSTTVNGSSCCTTQNVTVVESSHAADTKVSLSSACHPYVSLPRVTLERANLENINAFSPKHGKSRNRPEVTCDKLDNCETVQLDVTRSEHLPYNVKPCTSHMDITDTGQTSAPHSSQSPLLEKEPSETGRREVNEEDLLDVELDLDSALDLGLTQSSHSSEEEQLLSLQEMMEPVKKLPVTPVKETFTEPSPPGCHGQSKIKELRPFTTKSGTYKNNLDQMLKEINSNKRSKEIETKLLTACKEDLLRIAEYEEAEENREEGISDEQKEFLQRYSLMSSAIKEVPPGEVVFNLEKFGRIFNSDTLELRQIAVNPHGPAQKTLLWSSPAQLKLHLNIGLFQEAYDGHLPCPIAVTSFLFKMMSVHPERMVSEKILQALCDIACTAAYQIVKNGSQKFKVWVPSLADMALVLLNMGAAFVTLFPFEDLQPAFTEGDLLDCVFIKSEDPSSNTEQIPFPEHNYNNILKYLSYCMALCPRAYSDDELLLLLTMLGRVNMDTRLILQSSVELYPLQYKIVNNIRDWNTMLPRVCLAMTDVTDDHHNMCQLVQLLPDNTRGKELRQHLSLSMISKLLDGHCTYRPTENQIQLNDLRPYLRRMRPTTLLQSTLSSCRRSQKIVEDMGSLDQQSYYLCYSLLTLANEASNFQIFPAHQKEQLLLLCTELEIHVKCDIRESQKCLYRSKVKDLVARIYTKWQILLRRTRPLHDKLYDYWQPLPVDKLTSSQEQRDMDDRDDGQQPMMQDINGEESSGTVENEVVMISVKEEKDDRDDISDNTMPEEMEDNRSMDDTTEAQHSAEFIHGM